ncbi:MAG: SdpI family protein [Sphaerochaeta sp.]|jgi:uncharacterized membrane protein|nr:SdpI family protein [Sphaerochaeta sp.]MDX9914607.1 SdpI family protein [Sphaerochaeta sp.]
MKKRIFDRTTLWTTIVILLPIVPALALYHRLPEEVAIHFNAQGVADGWASRPVAILGLPLLLALVNLVMQFALLTDPKRDTGSRIFTLSRWILAPVSVLTNTAILLIALALPIRIERIIPLAISILFLAIGNYLPTCKQNYTIGIKIPWTLASEENWNKTHRLAGWVWTFASLFLIVAILAGVPAFPLFFAVTAIIVIVPIAYSYRLYRRGDPTDTL